MGVIHDMANNRTSFLRYINIFITVTLSIIVDIIVRNGDTGTFRTLSGVGNGVAIHTVENKGTVALRESRVSINSVLLLSTNSGVPTSYQLVRDATLAISRSTLANRDFPIGGSTSFRVTSRGAPLTRETGVVCDNAFVARNRTGTIIATINSSARFNGVTNRLANTSGTDAPLRRGLTELNGAVAIVNIVTTTVIFVSRVVSFTVRNAVSLSTVARTFVADVILVITTIPRKLPAVITISLSVGVVGLSGRGTLIGGVVTSRAVNYVDIVYSSGANALARGGVAIHNFCSFRVRASTDGLAGRCLARGVYLGAATSLNSNNRFVNGPARYTVLGFCRTSGTRRSYNGSCGSREGSRRILFTFPFSSSLGRVAAISGISKHVVSCIGNDPRYILTVYNVDNRRQGGTRTTVAGTRRGTVHIVTFTRGGLSNVHSCRRRGRRARVRDGVIFSNFITVSSPLHTSICSTIGYYHDTNIKIGVLANSGVVATSTVTDRLSLLNRNGITLRTGRVRRVDSSRLYGVLPRVDIVTQDAPDIGVEVIGLLGSRNGIITIANSKVGSTPTLGGTSINVTVNVSNARISGRTDSVILLSSSFTAVIGTIR